MSTKDKGFNSVRELIRLSLRLAHECKGLSRDDAALLKKLAHRSQAALERRIQKDATP